MRLLPLLALLATSCGDPCGEDEVSGGTGRVEIVDAAGLPACPDSSSVKGPDGEGQVLSCETDCSQCSFDLDQEGSYLVVVTLDLDARSVSMEANPSPSCVLEANLELLDFSAEEGG